MTKDRYGITKINETLTNGTVWYSKWNKTRTVASNDNDPRDARTLVTCGSLENEKFDINGDGTATWHDGGSPRIWIKGPWLNTEQTIYIKLPNNSTTSSIQLRSRSNHHGADKLPYTDMGIDEFGSDSISCGFGGYMIRWGEGAPLDFIDIGLEMTHGLYKRGIVRTDPYVIPLNQWVGYKMITKTSGSNVIVEGWNNLDETNQNDLDKDY